MVRPTTSWMVSQNTTRSGGTPKLHILAGSSGQKMIRASYVWVRCTFEMASSRSHSRKHMQIHNLSLCSGILSQFHSSILGLSTSLIFHLVLSTSCLDIFTRLFRHNRYATGSHQGQVSWRYLWRWREWMQHVVFSFPDPCFGACV